MGLLKTYEKFSDEKMKNLLSKSGGGFKAYHDAVEDESKKDLLKWTREEIIKNLPKEIEIFKDSNPFKKDGEEVMSFKIDDLTCFVRFENLHRNLKMAIYDEIKNSEWVDDVYASSLDYFIKRMKKILSKHIGIENIRRRKSEAGIDKYNL
jgi:hypothetical protein